jgi:hypothetical protein
LAASPIAIRIWAQAALQQLVLKQNAMFLTEIQAIEEVDPRLFEAVDRDGNQSLSICEHFRTLTPDTRHLTPSVPYNRLSEKTD